MINVSSYRGVDFNDNILSKVVKQLNKDLQLSGFDQVFETNLTINVFINELTHFLEELLLSNSQELYPLLYRIDVNQEAIQHFDNSLQQNLAQLIVEREFQKVVLKSEFSTS